jgi:hypothetical protein
MAKACYDYRKAPEIWKRMAEKQKTPRGMQYLSTHPANEDRYKKLLEWQPRAREEFDKSECSTRLRDFKNTISNFKLEKKSQRKVPTPIYIEPTYDDDEIIVPGVFVGAEDEEETSFPWK